MTSDTQVYIWFTLLVNGVIDAIFFKLLNGTFVRPPADEGRVREARSPVTPKKVQKILLESNILYRNRAG